MGLDRGDMESRLDDIFAFAELGDFIEHPVKSFLRDRFGLRALYGSWDFDGAAVEAADADSQSGWYVEPSFRVNRNWGVYARYEDLDAARAQDRFTQSEFGFNYWPTDGVVLKMDYRIREFDLPALGDSDFDAIDVGFGYNF